MYINDIDETGTKCRNQKNPISITNENISITDNKISDIMHVKCPRRLKSPEQPIINH